MTVSADRSSIPPNRVWILTFLVGVALWCALASLPDGGPRQDGRSIAALAAAFCTSLAMFGLRSVPIRWVVRGMSLASGMLLARFGELGALEGITGSWKVLAWLAATSVALVLAPSSRSVAGSRRGIALRVQDVPAPTTREHRQLEEPDLRFGRPGVPLALVVASVALVGAVALLLGPRAAQAFPVGARLGDALDLGDARGDNALVATERLDMTTRPRLTDEVVMTVRSPVASFWRTETFDEWDGSGWTRSQGRAALLDDGRVVPSRDDLAARSGAPTEQEFRLETGYATAVPSAPSAVQVDSPVMLAQRSDGTLVSPIDPMGSGTTYKVTSRQLPSDDATLASVSDQPVPDEVLERYAASPVATDRVRQLTREITDGADSDIARIRAIEGWLDDNTEYSLDAPLSPDGVDVVDHFLFETRLGWCEQIASSLVVMARLAGVPARLATGFTDGEWDAVGGRFVVRELNAHSWAEVWFPEVGWVTFDPTARVPQAGTAAATAGADARDWREIAGVALLVVAAASLFAGAIRRRFLRARARWSERRAHRVAALERWDVRAESEIERRGAAAGVERRPGDTLPTYAAAVAEVVDDEELVGVAGRIERHRYAPGGAGEPAAPGAGGPPDPG
jgi:transglutaminase-like putative cysteine protease